MREIHVEKSRKTRYFERVKSEFSLVRYLMYLFGLPIINDNEKENNGKKDNQQPKSIIGFIVSFIKNMISFHVILFIIAFLYVLAVEE